MISALALLAYLDPSDEGGGGLSTVAVVGIVVGAVLLAAVAVALVKRRA